VAIENLLHEVNAMRRIQAGVLRGCAIVVCLLAMAFEAAAVTHTVQGNINNNNLGSPADDGNRPWFEDDYNNGTITYTNPEGYFGSVLPNTSNTTTVMNADVGIGGDGKPRRRVLALPRLPRRPHRTHFDHHQGRRRQTLQAAVLL
jgi:hypothetical protein